MKTELSQKGEAFSAFCRRRQETLKTHWVSSAVSRAVPTFLTRTVTKTLLSCVMWALSHILWGQRAPDEPWRKSISIEEIASLTSLRHVRHSLKLGCLIVNCDRADMIVSPVQAGRDQCSTLYFQQCPARTDTAYPYWMLTVREWNGTGRIMWRRDPPAREVRRGWEIMNIFLTDLS